MAGFDRAVSPARWMVLALACITMLGSYYCYDIPSALNDQMSDKMGLSSFQLNMMYSVYSFPNIVLPLFGGYFVDKLGTVITLVVFSGFIAAGQAVFALGVSVDNYGLSLVGRVLFGLGGESLGVASSALLAIWFRGKEMAFAMGLNLSISRFGSVVNDYVSPALYSSRGLSSAVWFGFFICCASLAAAMSLSLVEKYAASRAAAEAAQALLASGKGADAAAPKEDEEIRLTDIQYFGRSFWLLTVSCLVVYGTILPFNIIAGSFLQDRYGYSLDTADRIMSIPFFISACLCPFLGGAVDKWGKRVHFQLGSAVAVVLVHSYFAWTSWTPYPPLVLQGLAYSVYAAALWPSVPFVVPEKSVGTAYGVITAVQNGGLAFIPMIDGKIHDDTDSYHYVELWFSLLGVIAVVFGFLLLQEDLRTGGVLSKPQQRNDAAAANDADKATGHHHRARTACRPHCCGHDRGHDRDPSVFQSGQTESAEHKSRQCIRMAVRVQLWTSSVRGPLAGERRVERNCCCGGVRHRCCATRREGCSYCGCNERCDGSDPGGGSHSRRVGTSVCAAERHERRPQSGRHRRCGGE